MASHDPAVADPAAGPTRPRTLPATGSSDVTNAVVLAGGLLVAGLSAFVLGITRRRRPRPM